MAGYVGVSSVTAGGDTGGNMISRWHWQRADLGAPTATDGGNAAASIYAFYNGLTGHYPPDIVWHTNPTFSVIDLDSGTLVEYLNISNTIPDVVGAGGAGHAAGVGSSVTWRTSTVSSKRLMRGRAYLVPTSSFEFQNDGTVGPSVIAALNAAATAARNSFATYNLRFVLYHRPAKGATTGGKVGPVTSFTIATQPTLLRTRRA